MEDMAYRVDVMVRDETHPFYGCWDAYCHRRSQGEAFAVAGMLERTRPELAVRVVVLDEVEDKPAVAP